LLCCLAKYRLDLYQKKATGTRAKQLSRWSFALENAIVSFSDQQLVTGISIIIGGLQQLQWGLAIYHFQEVGNLAWFSTMTHILTLTVLRQKMQLKSSLVVKSLRIILMGCLVVLLACVMAPLGYISSAYGFYGLGNLGYEDDQIQGPIPAEFPAWCLYHPSIEWDGEDGLPILNTGSLGYNKTYIAFTLGVIIYGYTSRVLLLFPGLVSESFLRIPPGQPWVSFELVLEKLKTRSDRTLARATHTATFITTVARLTHGFLYSLYVLILSGKDVYGSKPWEVFLYESEFF
jgi:hypothetical protein